MINDSKQIAGGSHLADRALLDNLASQILPKLIVNEPKKADAILTLLKKEDLTLADFLKNYPEYQDIKPQIGENVIKTIDNMKTEQLENFWPCVDFSHPILYYLTSLLEKKGILKPKANFEYQFQLRVVIYKNFNRYLNQLLISLTKEEALKISQELAKFDEADKFFAALEKVTKQEPKNIIDNFFKLIK